MREVIHRYGALIGSLLAAALFSAVVLSLLPGCDMMPPSGSPPAQIDEEVEIEEGETVRLGTAGPLLTFRKVSGDSRCPEGVDCITAGLASVDLAVTIRGTYYPFEANIPGLVPTPHESNEAVVAGGISFTLLELSPYPSVSRSEDPAPYRALIRAETYENRSR